MKVKCINIYNERTQKNEATHHRLTIGSTYVVIEMEIYPNKIFYRLVGDGLDQSPTLHNAIQFEVLSGKIPSNWALSQLNPGELIIGPAAWKSLGFWEDCFESDLTALEIYKREARIILGEESS